VPGVGEAVARAAQLFDDHTGYVADVLALPAPALAEPVPETGWTLVGVLLGVLSAALAAALAAAAVWRPDRRFSAARLVRLAADAGDRRLVLPLRRLHSGLLGDYVAWLTVGLAVLLVAVGAQM
jgi:multicomponent Na+:H+ antiporter subunit D